MVWGLFDSKGSPLPPRVFSNGKSQEDVVDEIIESFDDHDMVFLKGGVGSGKSIIGGTVSGAIGRGIINVPVKALQDQYKSDYEGRLNIRINGKNLKIRLLKGRSNFLCKKIIGLDVNCSSTSLRCTIPLPKDMPRWEVAIKCKYWSPIYSRRNKHVEEVSQVFSYGTHSGEHFYYKRTPGCGYYDQNEFYLDADVLINNNAKWFVDTNINRKPLVDIEIFDEADLFLDSLSLRTRISQRKLSSLLKESRELQSDLNKEGKNRESASLKAYGEDAKGSFIRFIESTKQNTPFLFDEKCQKLFEDLREFVKLLDTEKSNNLGMDIKRIFEYSESASYFVRKQTIVFFVPEPKIVLEDLLNASAKKLLFMSATMQNKNVLEKVFGIEDYVFVEGETQIPGNLYLKKSGTEQPINWTLWANEEFKLGYWKKLEDILKKAKRPTLVQVHALNYLHETNEYENIISKSQFQYFVKYLGKSA